MNKTQQPPTAIVLPTLDINIEDQWEKTRGIATPRFSTVSELYPNQDFQVIIVLGKYQIQQGKVRVKITCDIESSEGNITLSNGFNIMLEADLEKYIGLILLPKLPSFRFGSEHPAGEYKVIVKVDDTNSDEKEESIVNTITLRKENPNQPIELENELEAWRQNYYLDPKPNELIAAYCKSLDEIGINNDANILFYVEALNNSLFLADDINRLLGEGNLPQLQRNGLNILLARSNYENVDLENFSEQELKILHEIRDEGFYNPLLLEEQVSHPSGLDMLWSLFFANGKYDNIDKIIEALDLRVGKDPEKLKDLPQEEAIAYAIGSASAWSLGLNAKHHSLVRTYLIYKVNQPNISEYIKESLIAILTEIDTEEN
ncbi:hypothetical protein [uncultured Tenacibaculum sp.]|uniref:hypothetical protein n=1 Tax=uncultured Tenacibaculum sp. TaxID=174713 RepID=UPI0026148DD5|nr:hypothetical protein [uncultured Tenacibaculum sp.]